MDESCLLLPTGLKSRSFFSFSFPNQKRNTTRPSDFKIFLQTPSCVFVPGASYYYAILLLLLLPRGDDGALLQELQHMFERYSAVGLFCRQLGISISLFSITINSYFHGVRYKPSTLARRIPYLTRRRSFPELTSVCFQHLKAFSGWIRRKQGQSAHCFTLVGCLEYQNSRIIGTDVDRLLHY